MSKAGESILRGAREALDYAQSESTVKQNMERERRCHVCDEPFSIDKNGIANHINEDSVNYDADGDHVPYSLE